jgi:8-oxo-dGTP pyrophosphatase MutT (NUDIX family)
MAHTPEPRFEVSAGAVVVWRRGNDRQALLIRMRDQGFEIPKGHLEAGEDAQQAALRELREETGLLSAVCPESELGTLAYSFHRNGVPVAKRVRYFVACLPDNSPAFTALPEGVRERRWITRAEADGIVLVHEDLRPIIRRALDADLGG